MNTQYDFPVALQPVYTREHTVLPPSEIPNRLAVVRTDTGMPLGIVSKNYRLLNHKDVVEGFRKALDSSRQSYEEKIKIERNGAFLFATYKFATEQIEVRPGDFVSLQFIAKNSYDGGSSLQIALGAFRLVCSNGMVIGKQFFSFAQRHIGKLGGLDHNHLVERIGFLTNQFRGTLPVMEQMTGHGLRHKGPEIFEPKALNLPKYLCEEAMNRYATESDNTSWGFYNSLTAAITHNMKKESPARQLEYGQRAWALAEKSMNW